MRFCAFALVVAAHSIKIHSKAAATFGLIFFPVAAILLNKVGLVLALDLGMIVIEHFFKDQIFFLKLLSRWGLFSL